MKASFITLSLFFLALSASSCEKEETQTACASEKVVVKEVVDVEGIVRFDTSINKYIISAGQPGTYDSVDIGVVCGTVPSDLQEGAKVVFSGSYKEYGKPPYSVPAGYTFYYLELSKINIKKG